MVLGNLEWYLQKNETRPPTYTIHQDKLKMDERLKPKHYLKINKELIGLNTVKTIQFFKMSKRSEQRLLQGGQTEGP